MRSLSRRAAARLVALSILTVCSATVRAQGPAQTPGAPTLSHAAVAFAYPPGAATTDRAGEPRDQPGGTDPRRQPYVGAGVVVGAVAGIVYTVHAAKDAGPGALAAFVVGPFMALVGGVAGGVVGYAVSWIFVQ